MTAGIVVDNHKIEEFEKELNAAEFSYTIISHTRATSVIKVEHTREQLKQISELCKKVEGMFKK